LSASLGRFGGFDGRRDKQEQIYELLAPLARRSRARAPVPFYSMPEVSAFFGVALGTVGAVYRRMEAEGLVACLRGAGTVLPCRAGGIRPQVPVRGVVAVVNWLPGFLHVADIRFFLMQLERALWEHNFASTLVFYHEEEKRDPAFVDRIRAHRPNLVIWLTPGPADITTMNALQDAGIRLVAIADQPLQTRAAKYVIRWQLGVEAALRTWHQEGIRRVVVSLEPNRHDPVAPHLNTIPKELGIVSTPFPMEDGTMEDYVARLTAQQAGVLFDYDAWHAQVCRQAPRAFARLLAQRRVLNLWSLPIEPKILGNVRTDAVVMPWNRIIERIVGDVNSGAIFRISREEVFEAVWQPGVPAAQLSRLYAQERI
jgi:hypothetical protein